MKENGQCDLGGSEKSLFRVASEKWLKEHRSHKLYRKTKKKKPIIEESLVIFFQITIID